MVLQMLRHDDEVLLVLQMLRHDDEVLLVLQELSTPDCSLDRSHSSHFFLQQDDLYRINSTSPCHRTRDPSCHTGCQIRDPSYHHGCQIRDPSYHHGCQIRDNEVYLCCSDYMNFINSRHLHSKHLSHP